MPRRAEDRADIDYDGVSGTLNLDVNGDRRRPRAYGTYVYGAGNQYTRKRDDRRLNITIEPCYTDVTRPYCVGPTARIACGDHAGG